MSLSERIDSFVRERNNLNDWFRSLLTDVVRTTIEEVSRDVGISAVELQKKHAEKIVESYVEQESLSIADRCKGTTKDGKPCRIKGLANGFCKRHAGQYEEYAARQRFAKQQCERAASTPTHNHGPTVDEPVEDCPFCRIKYHLDKP
jgi:hypothetical protein